MRLLLFGLFSATVVACGKSDGAAGTGGAGGSSASSSSTASASGGAGGGSSCNDAPFVAATEDAGLFQGIFRYLAQSTLAAPVDVLSFELLDGAPAAPGPIALTDAGYESCRSCVVWYRGCDASLAHCQQTFLAQAGTLEVTSTGGSGATFAGQLIGVELVEVTLDPGTLVSTLVPGGASLCWASYPFSSVVQ